jgi:lysophospholipase L1-like esterase
MTSRTRLLAVAVALGVACSLFPAAASAKHAAPQTRYYLALGDSLSVGFQPKPNGVGVETRQGYTNDLYAFERKTVKGLKLVELGCPGDTVESLLTGKGNVANAKRFHCVRTGGSQLKAALKFLKTHRKKGEVPLITIDIGANDIDGCASVPAAQIGACVSKGENAIKTGTPKILRALRKAAPKRTAFSGMTLYDPVLAGYFSPNPATKALALASVPLLKTINGDITAADDAGKFKTADVADAFDSYDSTTLVMYRGQLVPKNVVEVCMLSWACTAPPQGPNIHANAAGYRAIAGAFEAVVGKLH